MKSYINKIKELSKINISSICRELKIDRANLLNGRTTLENEKRVYEAIVKKYKDIINE